MVVYLDVIHSVDARNTSNVITFVSNNLTKQDELVVDWLPAIWPFGLTQPGE